jgi:H+/Cl- antiporter ClcA/CBS domain-containing protein
VRWFDRSAWVASDPANAEVETDPLPTNPTFAVSTLAAYDAVNMASHASARPVESASTTDGLPVAPSLGPALRSAHVPVRSTLADSRLVLLSLLALVLGATSAFVAQILSWLVAVITSLCFHGHLSPIDSSPATNHLGLWVIPIPIIGAIAVGFMARFGSAGIRGHGIPEAMEQVLTNESRIPYRLTFLKPLSAALSIGTGGPFGLEGPIIATGGAFGSLIGQVLPTNSNERKTLLAAGAAAGMAATFSSPVSAVLLAIELLLFEFRPRSIIPCALAAATAAGTRAALFGVAGPAFPMPEFAAATTSTLLLYTLLGAVIGVISIFATRAVYAVEDLFDELPIHWMWWPAIGAVAVGVIGYFAPRTLGVGYDNITDILRGSLTLKVIVFLCVLKFFSWTIALGSGTSGGTLAPLFTVGGATGALCGMALLKFFPHSGIDVRVAALVGMAAIFSGASRAMLTSVVFAFETTHQPHGLPPLLLGCSMSYLVSCLFMPQTIMTEKISRRGVRVPSEYSADLLDQITISDVASSNPVTLRGDQTVGEIREWLASAAPGVNHQGFPVVDAQGNLLGVVTRRNFLAVNGQIETRVSELITRPPVVVYHDSTLRDAVEQMVSHDIGRLPVISRGSAKLVGIITRSDLLSAQRDLRKMRGARSASVGQPAPSAHGH